MPDCPPIPLLNAFNQWTGRQYFINAAAVIFEGLIPPVARFVEMFGLLCDARVGLPGIDG